MLHFPYRVNKTCNFHLLILVSDGSTDTGIFIILLKDGAGIEIVGVKNVYLSI